MLRSFDDHEHRPEYGILLVRDVQRPPGTGGQLAEPTAGTQRGGSVALAGNGWLDVRAADDRHAIRLEAHDSPPPDDRPEWTDVVETPMRSSGLVTLALGTGGAVGEPFELGPPGAYRVRVSRRPAGPQDGADRCRIQFWPASPVDPPRWLARGGPLLGDGDPGWGGLLPWSVLELTGVVREAGGGGYATIAGIRRWAVARLHREAWPDEPLPGIAPPGDPADRQQLVLRHHVDRTAADLAEVARQVGVPAPLVRADALPLLAACGLLETEGTGYRVAAAVPPAWERLRLPPERAATLRRADARARYGRAASDLAQLLLWAVGTGLTPTLRRLADRMLAGPDTVRVLLGYAAGEGLPRVEGDLADPDRPLTVVLPPGRPAGAVAVRVSGRSTAAPGPGPVAYLAPVPAGAPELPAGPPPRTGVVTADGRVVCWPAGAPVVVARRPGAQVRQALQTAHGILLIGPEGAVLARPDGQLDVVVAAPALQGVVDPTGRFAAVVEERAVHLVDLSTMDGVRIALPGQTVVAVRDRDVYLNPDAGGPTVRWAGGAHAERLPYRLRFLDPYTGTGLTDDGRLIRSGGTRQLDLGPDVELAPGGDRLYRFRERPPAVTVYEEDRPDWPRVHWLPADARLRQPPGRPVWEDRVTLLVPGGRGLLRLSVDTGAVQAVPVPDPVAVLVEPLPRI